MLLLPFSPLLPAYASDGPAPNILSKLHSGHPRLMLLDDDIPALHNAIAETPELAEGYRNVLASAERLLDAPVTEFVDRAHDHLLQPARRALDSIYRLGLAYRLEGDPRFAARGVAELMQIAALDTWNPSHFLDTAEICHAAAIGYDWFYDRLDAGQRATIVAAIREKGFRKGAAFYACPWPIIPEYWDLNWAVCNFNWNPVCNGGLGIAALAVAEEAPDDAAKILDAALASLPRAMAQFAPDGGWIEGPMYWEYATSYTAYFLAALESALGPAVIEPFLRTPGFAETGAFGIQTCGPLRKTFNFSDCHVNADRATQMFWLAKKFGRPEYAWYAAKSFPGAATALDIVWYSADQRTPSEAQLPLDAYFRHSETAVMRSAWEDRDAVFVGFKGGRNTANHGHLDLGSFVVDADGYRWAEDPGSDNYGLPFYFTWGRFLYYRLMTQGHNTLLVNGRGQYFDGDVKITSFLSTPEKTIVVADLSSAYHLAPGQLRRGIALLHRRDVLVRDEFRLDAPADIVWQLHTAATVEVAGNKATLRQGGTAFSAIIREPESAAFAVSTHVFTPPHRPGDPLTELTIHLQAPAGESHLAVQLSPGGAGNVAELSDRSLTQWSDTGANSK